MAKEVIKLEDLERVCKERQLFAIPNKEISPENIDGTNLTTNPDIKYRRKRIVSEVKKYKKKCHSKEFLNYCEFLIDKREECPKLLGIFDKILSSIRNDNYELIPESYINIIETYSSIITKAADLKPRYVKAKLEEYNKPKLVPIQHTKPFNERLEDIVSYKNKPEKPVEKLTLFKKNLKSNIQIRQEKAKEKLELWLRVQLGLCDLADGDYKSSAYHNYINLYRANSDKTPKYAIEVFDKYKDKMKDYMPFSGKLVHKDAITDGRSTRGFASNNYKDLQQTEGTEKLEKWLLDLFAKYPEPSEVNTTYALYFRLWKQGSKDKRLAKYAKDLFDKYKKELEPYKPSKSKFVLTIRTSSKEEFDAWVYNQIVLKQPVEPNVTYCNYIRGANNGNLGALPKMHRDTYMKYKDSLKQYITSQGVLVSKRSIRDMQEDKKVVKQEKPKQATHTNPIKYTTPDTLSMMIALAKKSGATELIIKL